MRLTSISMAVAVMVFMVATPALAQFVEKFESLSNGFPVNDLTGWSFGLNADSPPELGGNRGIINPDGGTQTTSTFDLAGQGLLPSANDPFYDVILDVYVFAGDNNQFTQGRSANARIYELQWNSGSVNWRTFDAGGTVIGPAAGTNSPDPLGNIDGRRKWVVRIDPVGNTATAFDRTTGTDILIGPTATYPTSAMTGLLLGPDRIGSNLGTLIDDVSIVVPEPSTALLAAAGLLGVALCGHRRRDR